MKLASVLSQYLINHKQLDLPGLGSFYTEGIGGPEMTTVRFEQKKIIGFDDGLVDFVTESTGKMRSLAISDLESQTEDMIQFLNTGKPYLINGLGTLVKKYDGNFDFVSNMASAIPPKREAAFTERKEVPQTYIEERVPADKSKRPVIIIVALVVIAIAATVLFYSKTSNTERPAAVSSPAESNSILPDTAKTLDRIPPQASNNPGGSVTYVLETAKELRATKRFNQLKKLNWPVALEKLDSLQYLIVMHLPSGGDTTHIKDSLSVLSGRKVFIRP